MKMETIIQINSIEELHHILNFEKPKHPLITIIDIADLEIKQESVGVKSVANLYCIALKEEQCDLEYGKIKYDFENGVLIFTAPNQVFSANKALVKNQEKGWLLYFHPDLLKESSLNKKMSEYNFFEYHTNEALHLSEPEKETLNNIVSKIKEEYTLNFDKHSKRLMISNLESLLNYSLRFYERQFISRKKENQGHLANFESFLNSYFEENLILENGFPTTQYFAEKMNISSNYLSDLLRKETGYSTKDHINNLVIKKAKYKLLGTNNSVSEIAYSLGFNYPHYFTRFFSSKAGMTPTEYRKVD